MDEEVKIDETTPVEEGAEVAAPAVAPEMDAAPVAEEEEGATDGEAA